MQTSLADLRRNLRKDVVSAHRVDAGQVQSFKSNEVVIVHCNNKLAAKHRRSYLQRASTLSGGLYCISKEGSA